ncbi:pyruvate carboxylase [Nocardioides soli]|uniref:Pyruvate carboxylase n=1 Tax=Nocardioides soli TaxID=1036020 RepID=A0A7W4Z3M7_9ACTN|nr:pyruvate carboxylase [Nocardioides soli]
MRARENGIPCVVPSPEALDALGDKLKARGSPRSLGR